MPTRSYPSEERIHDALDTIKRVCENHQVRESSCSSCPFSFDGLCPFIEGDPPKDWKLAPLPGDWKAFADAD